MNVKQRLLELALVLGCLSNLTGQEGIQPLADSPGEWVLFFGKKPHLVQFNVYVDGMPWEKHIEREVTEEFQALDRNHDARLSMEEIDVIRQVAGPERLALTRAQLSEFDVDPTDGSFSLAEFQEMLQRHIREPFVIQTDAGMSRLEQKLLLQLDSNDDLRLSDTELLEAIDRLSRLDFDEDSAVSLQELQPIHNPLLASRDNRISDQPAIPFQHVDVRTTAEGWKSLLLQRYAGPDGQGIAVDSMSGLQPQSSEMDVDKDGILNAHELEAACASIRPSAAIRIELPMYQSRPTQARLVWQSSQLKGRIPRLPTSVLRWSVDGIPIEIEAKASQVQLQDVRDFYLQQFPVRDTNQDKRLNQAELDMLGMERVLIVDVDRDGSGDVDRQELQRYLERISLALRTQLVVTVHATGQSIFAVVDREPDRRLSPRELRNLHSSLMTMDDNRDQFIDTNEFADQYRLVFSLGTPPLFQQSPDMQRRSMEPVIRGTSQGPVWYQQMDRNRDGELSWHEFLGTKHQFTAIDTDQDGSVSLQEAEHVDEASGHEKK